MLVGVDVVKYLWYRSNKLLLVAILSHDDVTIVVVVMRIIIINMYDYDYDYYCYYYLYSIFERRINMVEMSQHSSRYGTEVL